MSAGFQVSLAAANNQAAQLVINLRTAFQQIIEYQAWLAEVGSAGLQTLGMTAGDAATLISAFNDLTDLNNVWNDTASTHLTGTYNYQQFTKQLTAYS